jgi:hypothetical protein
MLAAPVPEAVALSADDVAVILPPPFPPAEICMAESQDVKDEVVEFECDPMDVSEDLAAKSDPYPKERKNSLDMDENAEISIHCAMAGTVRTLIVKPCDSIGSLKTVLAQSFECSATEVHIIFKGRIISCDVKSSLHACGVRSDSKLQILKRPISRVWFQLKVHFPMNGENPLSFRMHSSSTTLNVKKQLQELIGCPHQDICLFLGDGLAMNDEVSLRDYNIQDLEDIYCILSPSSTPQDIVIPLGEKAPFVSIKLNAEKLMEQIVKNQALRDRAAKCSEHKKLKTIDTNSDVANLRRAVGTSVGKAGSDGLNSASDEPSAKRQESFLGMRKGFLSAGKPRSKAKSDSATVSPPSTTPEHSTRPAELHCSGVEVVECERPRDSASDAAAERARKAGIPENLRTGRASVVASSDGSMAQLQKLLKDVLAPAVEGSVTGVAKEAPSACSPESEASIELLQASQAQKRSGRCEACRVKVGLTAITCRCGGTYCARHRYAEAHCCKFDYKTFQRSRLISVPWNRCRIFFEIVREAVKALCTESDFITAYKRCTSQSSLRSWRSGSEQVCGLIFDPPSATVPLASDPTDCAGPEPFTNAALSRCSPRWLFLIAGSARPCASSISRTRQVVYRILPPSSSSSVLLQ